ncbi:hypothetical protein R1flu_027845 [Riccia fluitans]|uniref:Uncharacterized protein n=1 Tax=Riccia fluitans TaxID=41844 RepID=A0ABD1XJZ8_9MARC
MDLSVVRSPSLLMSAYRIIEPLFFFWRLQTVVTICSRWKGDEVSYRFFPSAPNVRQTCERACALGGYLLYAAMTPLQWNGRSLLLCSCFSKNNWDA